MKKYLEQLQENCINHGNYIALKSINNINGISYSNLWDYSGRIYAYLKANGLGKEDIILICLPRDVYSMIAVIAVLRAGAAFTIVESNYPKERIEFIKNECNCRFIINEETYSKAINYDFLDGYEDADPHDACFVVYTSGSTGNPKGILHEYGKLEQIVFSQKPNYDLLSTNGIGGNPSPLNFVVSIMILLAATYFKLCVFIMPYEIVKNVDKFSDFIEEQNIECTFATYSLYKRIKRVPSCLKALCLGSEACNGVHSDKLTLTNTYCLSETAFTCAIFVIDKKYDITPVGKNLIDVEIKIVDENGNDLKQGEIGEIYIYDEYTRGYINLPEKTKKDFSNKMLHTHDLGYIDQNGNLIVVGRKDDMFKINGNRVEPAEIESNIKKVLNLENVVVKGFVNDARSLICAYLLFDELKAKSLLNDDGGLNISSKEIYDRLSDKLPYYMIPNNYVILKEYPLSLNGKILKNKLTLPNTESIHKEFVEPSNKTEEYLCSLFSKILKLKQVSVDEDFYALGGDSMSTINLISECELEGINAAEIYSYRTIRRIAAYYDNYLSVKNIDLKEKNNTELNNKQILLPEMQTVIECQKLAPHSIMWNIPFLFKLKDDIDLNKLKNAIDKVLKHHPVYSTKIVYDESCTLIQKYNENIYKDIEIINIEEKEFESIKNQLVKPFSYDCKSFVRKIIYKTENNAYFFIDHYHLFTDGVSLSIIFSQISKCYYDENYKLNDDFYYLMLSEEKNNINNKEIVDYYSEFNKKYFINHNTYYCLIPDNIPENKVLSKSYTIRKDIKAQPYLVNKNKGILSENEFFIVSVLLAMAKYNESDSSYIQWVFNGRDDKKKQDIAGLLYKSLPVACIYDQNKTLKEYYEEIVEQVRFTSTHNSLKIGSINDEFDYSLFFLFQKNIVNINDFPLAKELLELNEDSTADSLIEMMLFADREDKYYCSIEYDTYIYNHESIMKFFDYFNEISYLLSTIDDPCKVKVLSILESNDLSIK